MYNLTSQYGSIIYVNDEQIELIIEAVNIFESGHYNEIDELHNDFGTGVIYNAEKSEIDRSTPSPVLGDSVVLCYEDTFDTLEEADTFCMQEYGVNFNTMSFLYGDLFLFSN